MYDYVADSEKLIEARKVHEVLGVTVPFDEWMTAWEKLEKTVTRAGGEFLLPMPVAKQMILDYLNFRLSETLAGGIELGEQLAWVTAPEK